MTITCKNCNTSYKGKFCYNCGQPASTHRLDLHSVWHDIEHGLLHIDNGIFYTLIQLFTRPGHSIREYIEGKRVRHFKPVSLVIILATIYALLNHFLHLSIVDETANSVKSNVSGLSFSVSGAKSELLGAATFIESHFAILQLLQLPFYAAASWLAFRKIGYNYMEHLVINAFIRGQAIVISILFLPLVYWGFLSKDMSGTFSRMIEFGCLLWIFIQLFNTRRKFGIVKRTLLSMFYFLIEQLVIILIIIGVMKLFR